MCLLGSTSGPRPGITCTVSVGSSSANLGAAQESTDMGFQWLDLLPVTSSGSDALCMEGRRVPRLGIGSSLRCDLGRR